MRALLLALALLLLIAAPAYAGSATSDITSPADGTFPVSDQDKGSIHVTGHADFSPMDIICTYGPNHARVPTISGNPDFNNLPGGGDFSIDLPLQPLEYNACTLRAIPHGESNTNLDFSTLTGPRIGVARRLLAHPLDFDLQLAPFGGFIEFADVSDCGVMTSYGEDPSNNDYSAPVFECSDALRGSLAFDSTRPSVLVDTNGAYFPVDFFNAGSYSYPAGPSPALGVDFSTGLGSASSQAILARCTPGGSYPPNQTNCPNGVPDGVRLDHSATQTAGGALALIKESFVSTDGAAHTVDVWFGNTAGFDGIPVRWRFPGDPGFLDYSGTTNLLPPPSSAGTALLSQNGASFGSFSWSEPPDAVRFFNAHTFYTHYSFTVPAGGSHTVEFAYGSSFTQTGAESLGSQALAAFPQPPAAAPTPQPGPPLPGPTPPVSGGKTRLSFNTKQGANGTVTLTTVVPAAGSLSALETAVVARGAKAKTKKLTVSNARRNASKAGPVKLVLKLNKKGLRLLRSKHKLPVTLAVTYRPNAGPATKFAPRHLRLKLKSRGR